MKSKPSFLALLKPELYIVAMLLLSLTMYAHAGSTTKKGNSLSVDIPYSNPYTYMYGSIACSTNPDATDCGLFNRNGRKVTSVSFNPSGTYSFYTEQVSFCGDVQEAFLGENARGPLVVTYKRVARLMPGGVACYQLQSVDKATERLYGD